MDFPEEDLPDVAEAAHAVVQEAKDAGVFVFTGGLDYDAKHVVVATDGMVTDGPYPESKELIGGRLGAAPATSRDKTRHSRAQHAPTHHRSARPSIRLRPVDPTGTECAERARSSTLASTNPFTVANDGHLRCPIQRSQGRYFPALRANLGAHGAGGC